MKTIKYAVAAVALSALSFGAFAVEPVSSAQAQNMNKVGVVSADGATTPTVWKPNWLRKRLLPVQADTPLPPLTAITS